MPLILLSISSTSFRSMGGLLEPKKRTVLRASQFAGQQKEFVSQFSERQLLPRFLEACPLKRRNEIVGEPDDFQVQCVGCKRSGGYLSKREVLSQFTDPRLHAGAAVIEMPDAGWGQIHVGHPGAIHVAPQGEQCGLRFLYRDKSSRDHEMTGLWPTMWAILELCHLPPLVHGFIV